MELTTLQQDCLQKGTPQTRDFSENSFFQFLTELHKSEKYKAVCIPAHIFYKTLFFLMSDLEELVAEIKFHNYAIISIRVKS